MIRRSISRPRFRAILACIFLAVPCNTALAADPNTDEEARKVRTSREILMHEDDEFTKKGSWLSPNFHLHKKSGIGFAKKLKWGDRPLVLRLRGPVMRKQKALGLRFKLNF